MNYGVGMDGIQKWEQIKAIQTRQVRKLHRHGKVAESEYLGNFTHIEVDILIT